jgi:hypothetical protein
MAEAFIEAPQTLAINFPGFLCSNTPRKMRAHILSSCLVRQTISWMALLERLRSAFYLRATP